jgi:hypothetical protein
VLSPRGNVQIDARTNTLIITDLPTRLDTVQQLLGTIDRAEPQVEIEARIITTTGITPAPSACSGASTAASTRPSATPPGWRSRTTARSEDVSASRDRSAPIPARSRWTAPAPPSICRSCPTSRRPARSAWRWDRSTAR